MLRRGLEGEGWFDCCLVARGGLYARIVLGAAGRLAAGVIAAGGVRVTEA